MAPPITVFGATGFLGQRIVRRLHEHGCAVRIASRHLGRAHALFGTDDPRLQAIEGDIRNRQSVADAIAGVRGVVNAVSLYVERGNETFHAVHVEAAQRVAMEARRPARRLQRGAKADLLFSDARRGPVRKGC